VWKQPIIVKRCQGHAKREVNVKVHAFNKHPAKYYKLLLNNQNYIYKSYYLCQYEKEVRAMEKRG
jgi:hypothetical protein